MEEPISEGVISQFHACIVLPRKVDVQLDKIEYRLKNC